MATNFKFNNGGTITDFSDVFIRRDLFSSGNLWNWGENNYGTLGDNSSASISSPVQTVAGGTNWKEVSKGGGFTAAIKTDGTLWTWGQNNIGQLGDGTAVNKSSPVQTIAGGINWKQVSGGSYHIAAIKTNGELWLWGNNLDGNLGNNTNAYVSGHVSSPVQTVAGGTNWKQVCAGHWNTAAIKTDGTLWTWGDNQIGYLGDGTITDRSSPVQTVAGGTNWKQVAISSSTAAIKTNGELWVWGYNYYGELGDNNNGNFAHKSSPVQTVAGGINWKQVSVGNHSIASIKTNGELWLWGRNDEGQLGDNTSNYKSSPVQTVAGGTAWKQVSMGLYATAAIKTNGELWMWGTNYTGALGDNNNTGTKLSPVQTVAGGTNWKQVSAGWYGGGIGAAAITDIF